MEAKLPLQKSAFMKVSEIMTSKPVFCPCETNLASVTALLWQHGKGAVVVVDREHHPIGLITDRDICIALGTRGKLAQDVTVGEVITGKVFTCSLDANVHEALACMQRNHVRRLIVTSESGGVAGVLSIDDLILNVQWSDHKDVALTFVGVIRTLKKITYPGKCSTPFSSERATCKTCESCKAKRTLARGNAITAPATVKADQLTVT
jgi:signal-transduction protein with cAMP-binding, CBS, and nucleotidyltransferase domain